MAFCLLFLLRQIDSFAALQGKARIDSLLKVKDNIKKDSNGVKVLSSLSFEYKNIDPNLGLKYGYLALDLAKQIKWQTGIYRIYRILGQNYFNKNEFNKSIEFYKLSLNMANKSKDTAHLAKIYNNIGAYYYKMSNYHTALQYYFKALKIEENSKRREGVATLYGNLALIYSDLKEYDKALEYMNYSVELHKKENNLKGISTNFINIAVIYNKLSKNDLAIKYYKQAIEIDEKLGNISGLAANYKKTGNLFSSEYKIDSAIKYYEKSRVLNHQLNNLSQECEILGNIANLFYMKASDTSAAKNLSESEKSNYVQKSIDLYNQAIKLGINSNDVLIMHDLYRDIAEVYELQKDYKNAYIMSQKYRKIADSMYIYENKVKIEKLENDKINQFKDQQIKMLKYEKHISAYRLWASLLALFLVAVFLIAYFLRFKEKKKLTDELITKNNEIEIIKQNALNIIQFAPFPILIANPNGSLVEANQKALLYLEIENQNLSDLNIVNFIDTNTKIDDLKSKFDENGKIESFIIQIQNHKKNKLWVSGSIIEFQYYDKDSLLIMFHDISKRIEIEEKLYESEKQLREALLSKDKFFSIISHDLRGPFSVFLGYTELMYNKFHLIKESEQDRIIKNTYLAANSTYRLLENLLQWAATQTANMPFDPKIYSIESIVKQVYSDLELQLKSKEIKLIIESQEDYKVKLDENMIATVIRNLCSNSIKFSHQGQSIVLSIKKQDENNIEISVKDNGIGMNQSTQADLFNIGKKTMKEGTNKEKGTGLGLILCKEFVEYHNGKLWVESQENQGTKITFTLPLGD